MSGSSPLRAPLPHESAAYAGDLLDSLQKIAHGQGQILLAHLLALAVLEARALSGAKTENTGQAGPDRDFQLQQTRLPG